MLIELSEAGAEFLLVGGWAVILYGHVRATDDMNVFVRASKANSARVVTALEAFGAPLQAHGVLPTHFEREGNAYRFGIAPLKVEVLIKISGVHEGPPPQAEGLFTLPRGRRLTCTPLRPKAGPPFPGAAGPPFPGAAGSPRSNARSCVA